MFFRRKESQIRPSVKKVSELINTKSHNQKKYVSLLLVPSYSTGKTRSLRIPRAVLHGVAIFLFVIFSVVIGFYLRSLHFERAARNLSLFLDETVETFYAFRYESELVQNELVDATVQIYEQLSKEQMRAQFEIYHQERRHQGNLEDVWNIIDEIEYQIRELEEVQQEIRSNLGARSVIPPIANILLQMDESQETLRLSLTPEFTLEEEAVPVIGLLSFAQVPVLSEDKLINRLDFLMNELEIQRQLLNNLEYYRQKMEPYLLNYPTLWPIRGRISSGFGWRRDPFGGRTSQHHNGIDIPARTGTAIRAAGGGTVTFSGWNGGYGNTVIIDHGIGITTMYSHNSRNRVSVGERVERGDIIANVGSTGRSTGPHLHYEVRRNGTAINPVPFLIKH